MDEDDLLLGLAAAFEEEKPARPSKPTTSTARPFAPRPQPGYIPARPTTISIASQQTQGAQMSQAERDRKLNSFKGISQPQNNRSRQQQQIHDPPKEELRQRTFVFQKTGLQIKNPVVSAMQLESKLGIMPVIKLSDLQAKHRREGLDHQPWCSIAVVGEKSHTKQTSTGRSYAIWKLTDLNEACITIFLFGNAYEDFWKETEGTLVAVISPKVRSEDGDFTITVDDPSQFMVLGRSADFGYCKSRKKNGDPCRIPVNMNKCAYCKYHVAGEFKRIAPMRKELQGGALATAFKIPTQGGGLSWAPGNFDASKTGVRPLKSVGSKGMQNVAVAAAERGSAAGARYLKTVANPLAAVQAAAEHEKRRRERERVTSRSAPIPLARTSKVTIDPKQKIQKQEQQQRRQQQQAAGMKRKQPLPPSTTSTAPTTTTASKRKPSTITNTTTTTTKKDEGGFVNLDDDDDVDGNNGGSIDLLGFGPNRSDPVIDNDPARQRAIEILRMKAQDPKQSNKPVVPPLLKAALEEKKEKERQQLERQQQQRQQQSTGTTTTGTNTSARPATTTTQQPAAAPPTAFELAFGSIAAELEASNNNKTTNTLLANLADADKDAQIFETLDILEKHDEAATKMDSIKVLEVQAWQCTICNKLSEYYPKHCAEAHREALKKTKSAKRWWQCQGCKQRFSTVGKRHFTGRCPKCDVPGTDFISVSMLRNTGKKELDFEENAIAGREYISTRGVEQKWVNQ